MAQPPPPFSGRFAPPPPFGAFPPQVPAPFPPPPAPFPASRPALPPFLLPPPSEPAPFFRSPAVPPLFPPWPPAERPPPPRDPEAADDDAERRSDERWLEQFLARRDPPALPPLPPGGASPELGRQLAVRALRAVSRLAELCRALRSREAEGRERGWERERAEAEALLEGLRDTVRPLREPGYVRELGRKAEKARKRRERLQRRKREARAAKEEEAARAAEREAEIDRWRAKCIQEVEEKNRERELKAAADSVLSEVRKKQADTKRMVDILGSLEKLRKLRKEAAAKKGVCPPPSADEAFENQVESLRALLKNRTELYEAEERALRVMLEGEQEEERKREMEKKEKKEREKLLQQKRDIDSKLFGDPDEFPLAHLLQPFREYYLQAELSAAALIQIRQ
ncbi:programmed cell death protein 7-like isoform X3 [Excalfactoria chinensis]|uniref:programmed cell death protein 7-like isoform X3 n=1 Tax=Excalfactoria chinensis TaxID=46218 RepID=UPI003B3A9CE2